MKVETISIMKHCSADGCRRVGIVAEKVSDFWVTKCREHVESGKVMLGKDSMARMAQVYGKKARAA